MTNVSTNTSSQGQPTEQVSGQKLEQVNKEQAELEQHYYMELAIFLILLFGALSQIWEAKKITRAQHDD